jgi:hypothetical protein
MRVATLLLVELTSGPRADPAAVTVSGLSGSELAEGRTEIHGEERRI